jgi:hypothetical protein
VENICKHTNRIECNRKVEGSWSGAAKSQATAVAKKEWILSQSLKKDCDLSNKLFFNQVMVFVFLVSKTVRKVNFFVLCHQNESNLL